MAGFLARITGGTLMNAIEGVGNVVDKFVETEEEKKAFNVVMARMMAEPSKAQAEITKMEAAHRSIWVAGWRPGIGWVCCVSLALFYIPQFTLGAYFWYHMSMSAGEIVPYPVSAEAILELVLAMIGMGTLRTVEKMVGKSK